MSNLRTSYYVTRDMIDRSIVTYQPFKKLWQTDRPTDQPTDRRTDRGIGKLHFQNDYHTYRYALVLNNDKYSKPVHGGNFFLAWIIRVFFSISLQEKEKDQLNNLKCFLSLTHHVNPLVGWLVGWSVIISKLGEGSSASMRLPGHRFSIMHAMKNVFVNNIK